MSGAVDLVEGAVDTIAENPALLAFGLTPALMAAPTFGAATATGLTEAAAASAGVEALGGMGASMVGAEVAPTVAGLTAMEAMPGLQATQLAGQMTGLVDNPWIGSAAELASPGSSFAMSPASGFNAMDALSGIGNDNEAQVQQARMAGGRPGNVGPASPFMAYAPDGVFPQISPTAGFLDEVQRMGLMGGMLI